MNNLSGIRAVIFDLFHTLVSLEVAKAPGQSTPEILGIDREKWNYHWLNEEPADYVLGLVPVEIPIRRLAFMLNPGVSEEQIQDALRTRHLRFSHTLRNVEPETIAGLERLRRRGLKLGLISNCGEDEIADWEFSPLAPYFPAAVFSCRVRLKKPDREIYHLAARHLGVKPEECLFVGNGGSDELGGAARAGMTPVLLVHHILKIKPERIVDLLPAVNIVVRTVDDLFLLWGAI